FKNYISASRLWYNVRVQQAIFDLLARGHFLNVVQYNGYDGCGDSCIKGVVKGRQIYFPFSETTEKRKNHEFYLKSSKHNTHRSVQGIKGPTPLSSILQLPNQIPYDSMHLIYHEHVKTLLKFWQNMFDNHYGDENLDSTIEKHDLNEAFSRTFIITTMKRETT
ncbi:unnamed protein product, partial [Rotaria sp. Silwood1]